MRLELKMNLDNDAFICGPDGAAIEVTHIFNKLIKSIDRQGVNAGSEYPLIDSNGNKVGLMRIIDDSPNETIFLEVVENLIHNLSDGGLLEDDQVVAQIRQEVNFPNSGDSESDFESVRDQVMALVNQKRVKFKIGNKTVHPTIKKPKRKG